MAYSDYEHCPYCVADKQAGRPLPDEHGYKGLYTGDTDVPNHINVICSHHLKALQDEITTSRDREAQHLADIKALQSLLHRWVSSYVGGRHGEDARSLVDVTYSALTGAPLAHYDDAK